jgi:hypothetical protein
MKERPRQKIEGADEVPPPLRYPLQVYAPLRRRLRDEDVRSRPRRALHRCQGITTDLVGTEIELEFAVKLTMHEQDGCFGAMQIQCKETNFTGYAGVIVTDM